jgi:hypothetical protein
MVKTAVDSARCIWNEKTKTQTINSKPTSRRRRLLIKHRVDVPADDAIRGEFNRYLQVKVDDDVVDDDLLILWKKRSNWRT